MSGSGQGREAGSDESGQVEEEGSGSGLEQTHDV